MLQIQFIALMFFKTIDHLFVSHSFVIGMCRLFQGPIQSSSSSDWVRSLCDPKGSLTSWLSTVDSCSSTFCVLSPSPFTTFDFEAILSGPVVLEARDPLEGLVVRFCSPAEAPVIMGLFKGIRSSCVTASLSSFLKCFPSRTGELSLMLLVCATRRVRIIEPFWAKYMLPLMLLWLFTLDRRFLCDSGALSSPVELVSYSRSTISLILFFLPYWKKKTGVSDDYTITSLFYFTQHTTVVFCSRRQGRQSFFKNAQLKL